MFCRYCGAPLPDGAKFCGSCGKPVASYTPHPSAPKQAPSSHQVPKRPVQNSPYPDRSVQNSPYPNHLRHDTSYSDRSMQNFSYDNQPQDSFQHMPAQHQQTSENSGGFIPPSLHSVTEKFHSLLGSLTQSLGKPRQNVQKGPRVKVKKTFNIGNFICWGGCALAAISLFLPYVSVSMLGFSEDQALIDTDDGTIFLVIVLVIAVVNLLRLNIGTIILSVLHFYLVYMEHDNIASSYVSALSDFGMGHTLQFLGAILMLAASVAGLILWMKRKHSAI